MRSPSGKWTWKSRKGTIVLSVIVLAAILFVSLTSFGVAKAVQDHAASDKNAAIVGQVSSTVENITSTFSSAGHLITATSSTTSYTTNSASTRFVTSVRSGTAAQSSASASSTATVAPPAMPAYDYSSGHLFGAATNRSACFPYVLPEALSLDSAPSLNRSQWWCEPSLLYGWLGFSYPLEDSDCSDSTNSFDQINKDFARMKSEFGATLVRVYAPECRELSLWENLVRAGVENGMGVIVLVSADLVFLFFIHTPS